LLPQGIVVLDLDSDDEEQPNDTPPRDFVISSALLSRLAVTPAELRPPPAPAGQLVLYRPPLWKDQEKAEEEVEERNHNIDEQDVYPIQDDTQTSADDMEIEAI
jgi:hypothetical protein